MRRGVAPLIRASAPARNSTGTTFPPIKTGRPDTYELSRKQNQVRLHAREQYSCNVTPTWQKGKYDGIVNVFWVAMVFGGFASVGRCVYDMTTDSNKIE